MGWLLWVVLLYFALLLAVLLAVAVHSEYRSRGRWIRAFIRGARYGIRYRREVDRELGPSRPRIEPEGDSDAKRTEVRLSPEELSALRKLADRAERKRRKR